MAFKMFNALRTIDRMKKYNYMKKSDFYKRARKLATEYNKANKQEKAIVKKLMEQHFNLNKAYAGVKKLNDFIDKERATLFDRYATDELKKGIEDGEPVSRNKLNEFMTREQFIEYVDYIEKIKKAYEDYFYKADDAIDAFRNMVVLGGKTIDDAFEQFREQADGVPK